MTLLPRLLLLFAMAVTPAHAAAEDSANAPYRIGAADVLRITVWEHEALNSTVPVRPDGMISLPLLNDVRAAGLTPLELREELILRLAEFIGSPELSVIVEDVRSRAVSVLGEVDEPGRYPFQGHLSVLEAIAIAGGFTEFASPSRIVILRRQGGAVEQIPFNYNRVLSRRGTQNDLALEPGDIVMVP